ncbi:MAG: thermonuclease family protein [Methylococcaceae bacterium]
MWAGLGLTLWFIQVTPAAEVYRWVDTTGHTHYADHSEIGAKRLALAPHPERFYRVKRVYDGDTVQLDNGDKVRLLGINTPEIGSPRKSAEPGGDEARTWLQQRLNGQIIRLEPDVEQRDHYGRLLAYVYTDQGEHINLSLVQQGLAHVDIYPPNVRYAAALMEAERQAEKARLGLWKRPEYAVRELNQTGESFAHGWQRLLGRVERIEDTRAYRTLILAGGFQARIARANQGAFPNLNTYLGQRVELRGWIYRYRDKPALLLKHPSAIRTLPQS